jgi:hypothetical protein
MSRRRIPTIISLCAGALALTAWSPAAQQPPAASAARILLLPHKIVSGEHATLAVLDTNGRLTPGARIDFSNGDHVTTDTTGRGLFVAPLNPGIISAVIAGRPGRVYTTILTPTDASAPSIEISAAPRVATLSDRFDIAGREFCGDADANTVTIAGLPALVLASSPMALVVVPPTELDSGNASVVVSCAKRDSERFSIRFIQLTLEANSSPLAPGDHRPLTVHIKGTTGKIGLEARNLAPDIAELVGGNPARVSSSGGTDNAAQFQLTGKQHGNFVVSIRLLPNQAAPRP